MIRLAVMLRRLARDKQGAAVIETALVLPALLLTTFATNDLVQGFKSKLQLQQYAQTGADLVVSKITSPPTTSQIQAEVASVSGLPSSAVTVQKWTECNGVNVGYYGACTDTTALRADYIGISVTNTYNPALNALAIPGFMRTTTLTGYATVRLL